MRKLLLTLLLSTLFALSLHAQEPTNESVTKLYIATFDRAPDSAGLEYWVKNSNLSLEDIATSFFDQPETQALYPTETSIDDFINAIYTNLFKRDADSAGAEYWKKDLESGTVNKSVFILAVVNGAKDDDATLLANKTEVGLAFVNSGSNDVDQAKSIMSQITIEDSTVNDALVTIASFASTDTKEDIETPDLSVNTSTGTSTATGSTTTTPSTSTSSGSTSTGSTNTTTTTDDDEEDVKEVIDDDDELLPNF